MRWGALVVAAGRGERFGGFKQLIEIAGRPMLEWSIQELAKIAAFESFVVVTANHAIADVERRSRALLGDRLFAVIEGGATRQESVRLGIEQFTDRCDAIAIHDGARPCVRHMDVRRAMDRVAPGRAALLAHRIADTLKEAYEPELIIRRTIPRADVWGAQTPQLAMLADIRTAHRRAIEAGITMTDDVSLLESGNVETVIVPGSAENIKVTHTEDRRIADAILRTRESADGNER